MATIWYYLRFPNPTGSLREKLRRVDFLGTFFIVTATTALLFALESSSSQYPWSSTPILSCLALGVFLCGCFILVEWKVAAEPLIPLRLFKNRTITAVYISNWMFGTAFFGIIINLPSFFQIVQGSSATASGLKLLPIQLSIAITSAFSGYLISRFGRYLYLYIIGTTLMTIGMVLISFFSETLSDGSQYGFMVITGVGLGLILSSSIIAVQSASEVRDLAVVTGTANFMRILGGAIGVAICSSALQSRLDTILPAILSPDLVGPAKQSATFIHDSLPASLQAAVIHAYVEGFQLMYHVLVAFTATSLIASLFVKHHPLKKARRNLAPDPTPVHQEILKDVEKQVPLEDENEVAGEPSLVLSKVPTSDAIGLGTMAMQTAVVGSPVVYDTKE
ncbi:major facilitator superfamily domain-containing protein [Jimgerdemannia flammicorona]|uniref:Major facilitator superfamily domain-containing protein n=1 Tax=Jimgerdemannia flammicorona TaxID=994334 RepID=A0A433DK61_9FUNG|nr:major facilitator superfamily domain-containing protein [Jimgerdemannia flammicorona]